MLEKSTIVDLIEVTQNNSIQVRTATVIAEDGVEISRNFHRHVVSQGDDVSNEDPRVQVIATALWSN